MCIDRVRRPADFGRDPADWRPDCVAPAHGLIVGLCPRPPGDTGNVHGGSLPHCPRPGEFGRAVFGVGPIPFGLPRDDLLRMPDAAAGGAPSAEWVRPC